jgi:hypothetical protein
VSPPVADPLPPVAEAPEEPELPFVPPLPPLPVGKSLVSGGLPVLHATSTPKRTAAPPSESWLIFTVRA